MSGYMDNLIARGQGKTAMEFSGGFETVNPVDAIGEIDGIGEAVSPDFLKENGFNGATGADNTGGIFGKGMGSTLAGIGSVAQAAAGIYNAYNQKKYQDKLFNMEESRVKRETARQDQQQKNYEKVFG